MKRKVKILMLLITNMVLVFNVTFGQISQGGVPYSFNTNIRKKDSIRIREYRNISTIKMPIVKQSQVDSIIRVNKKKDKVFQFAVGFNVDINIKESSVTDSLENGLLYRIVIISKGALSIGLIFKKYMVPLGAKLFLYNQEKTDIKGAFTSNNNKINKPFPLVPIKGEEIVIEYFEPYFFGNKGEIIIGKISHGFIDPSKLMESDFESLVDCSVDINCPEGNNWQIEKRAVCKIIIDGTGLCTGTLINNAANNGTPYFLTANHCIDNQKDAENSVFIFNYEKPLCNSGDGSVSQSISGADLIANRSQSDFALLELSKKPFSTFSPFYAGWDNQNILKNNVVGIHHPYGAVKKISIENDNIQSTDFSSSTINNTSNHWMVSNWDIGVTKRGSSGSALFDNDHRIIGQLHGGSAACNGTTDNDLPDWYGKFSTSWNEGSSSSSRLSDWLDPNNNILVLNGINGCTQGAVVNLTLTNTIYSGSVELYQAINTITASNRVESGANVTYEAGNQVILTDGFVAEAGSNFIAKTHDFNCVITCDPISLTKWTSSVCKGAELCFATNAKNYSATIYNSSGVIEHQSSGSISGNSVCFWNTSNVRTGAYIATVSFSTDCEEISNTYSVIVYSCERFEKNQSDSTNNYTPSINQNIIFFNESGKSDFNVEVLPNPSKSIFSVSFSKPVSVPYSLELINSNGIVIYQIMHLNASKVNIDHSGVLPGIYYIKLHIGKDVLVKKIVINK